MRHEITGKEVKATRTDTMYELIMNLILYQIGLERASLQNLPGSHTLSDCFKENGKIVVNLRA